MGVSIPDQQQPKAKEPTAPGVYGSFPPPTKVAAEKKSRTPLYAAIVAAAVVLSGVAWWMSHRPAAVGFGPACGEGTNRVGRTSHSVRRFRPRGRLASLLEGGEEVRGVIEYYDQSFIRLTRDGEPNLFIFKHDIKYIQEAS